LYGGTSPFAFTFPVPLEAVADAVAVEAVAVAAGAAGRSAPGGRALMLAVSLWVLGSFVVGTGVGRRHAATFGVVSAHAG